MASSKRRTEIGDNWISYSRSMLESPAFRVLSYAAMRVMHRIELEHMNHGGAENGRLQVTYDQFVEYGIDRKVVAPAIRELATLGFLEVMERGYAAGDGKGKANRFRLTYVNSKTREQPSHEWRRVDTKASAASSVAATKGDTNQRAIELGKRSWTARKKKQNSVPKAEPNSVPKTEPNGQNLSSESGTTRLSSENGTTIYNLGVVAPPTLAAPPCDHRQAVRRARRLARQALR
jgi:hypothetical protein